jgi:hypothetical protein
LLAQEIVVNKNTQANKENHNFRLQKKYARPGADAHPAADRAEEIRLSSPAVAGRREKSGALAPDVRGFPTLSGFLSAKGNEPRNGKSSLFSLRPVTLRFFSCRNQHNRQKGK